MSTNTHFIIKTACCTIKRENESDRRWIKSNFDKLKHNTVLHIKQRWKMSNTGLVLITHNTSCIELMCKLWVVFCEYPDYEVEKSYNESWPHHTNPREFNCKLNIFGTDWVSKFECHDGLWFQSMKLFLTGDAMRRLRYWSRMAQIINYLLADDSRPLHVLVSWSTAPRHDPNQCWLRTVYLVPVSISEKTHTTK